MKTGLGIAERNVDEVQILSLTGYLDGHTFVDLERYIDRLVGSGRNRLVLELAGLTYIASAGIGVFINGQYRAQHGGGNLQLANASANVREILTTLGLDTMFVIHDTVDEGVRAARA